MLRRCGLKSPVLWPAFAACSGLHSLCLEGDNLTVMFDTLMMLTALSQLTELNIGGMSHEQELEHQDAFEAALPSLKRWVL